MSIHSHLAFEIPSKTFIIGEYLAIQGTASMILASEPSFFVKIIDDKIYGFHPDSPAGFIRKELGHENVGYSFFDPHEGRGGFGRSTAEYLAVQMYELTANQGIRNTTDYILNNLEDFVTKYQSSCGGEYKPSGADMVAQVCGGLCWYDGMNYLTEKLAWPFPGYDIFIFHTGKKLATHDHLKDLKSLNFKELIPILIASRTAIEQGNLKVFCESINYYYDILNELKLSDQRVCESVLKLRRNDCVLAAKGCGAMGVDTVIVVGESSNKEKIKDLCFGEDFQYISSLSQAHQGATVRREM